MTTVDLTETEHRASVKRMQQAFTRNYMIYVRRFEFIFPNVHMGNGNEADILGFRPSGFRDEVEIKTSKSDFRADFKKSVVCDGHWGNKHERLEQGRGIANYFSFYVPERMQGYVEERLPDYAGLYVFHINDRGTMFVEEVKRAPRMHSRKPKVGAANRYLVAMYHRYRDQVMLKAD